MRIRVKARVYNDVILAEREKIGLSQAQFAEFCGLSLTDYAAIESLKMVSGEKMGDIREKLQKVCDAVCMEFDQVFPPDYLQMLVDQKLPRRRKPYEFVREIALDALPPSAAALALPDPIEMIETGAMKERIPEVVREQVATLRKNEQKVLEMRFGFDGQEPKTLEQCGRELNVTKERVRQIQEKALRKLRHPLRSKPMQVFRL